MLCTETAIRRTPHHGRIRRAGRRPCGRRRASRSRSCHLRGCWTAGSAWTPRPARHLGGRTDCRYLAALLSSACRPWASARLRSSLMRSSWRDWTSAVMSLIWTIKTSTCRRGRGHTNGGVAPDRVSVGVDVLLSYAVGLDAARHDIGDVVHIGPRVGLGGQCLPGFAFQGVGVVAEELTHHLVDVNEAALGLTRHIPTAALSTDRRYRASARARWRRASFASCWAATSSSTRRSAAVNPSWRPASSRSGLACTSAQWVTPSTATTRIRSWTVPPAASVASLAAKAASSRRNDLQYAPSDPVLTGRARQRRRPRASSRRTCRREHG